MTCVSTASLIVLICVFVYGASFRSGIDPRRAHSAPGVAARWSAAPVDPGSAAADDTIAASLSPGDRRLVRLSSVNLEAVLSNQADDAETKNAGRIITIAPPEWIPISSGTSLG